MRRYSKALVAVTAGVAMLIMNAAPSAAVSTNTWEFTAGNLTVNLTPTYTQTLGTGGSTDPLCGATFTTTFDSATSWTSGTATATIRLPFSYGGGSTWVIVASTTGVHVNSTYITTGTDASKWLMTLGNSTGTGGHTITGAQILQSSGVDSCTATSTTNKCGALSANVTSSGVYTGTPDDSTHHLSTSSTSTNIGATSPIAAAGCTPPFSALNGKTLTISSATAHVIGNI